MSTHAKAKGRYLLLSLVEDVLNGIGLTAQLRESVILPERGAGTGGCSGLNPAEPKAGSEQPVSGAQD